MNLVTSKTGPKVIGTDNRTTCIITYQTDSYLHIRVVLVTVIFICWEVVETLT